MLMLSVNRDETIADLAQLRWVGSAAVDPSGAALADLALKRHAVEHCFDRRPVGAVADLVGSASGPKRQAQRVDDQRLAASGLSGEEVETRSEAHCRLRDQRQV